nr:hypothetical protein BaRGS_026286 [Batillaria attramentaria]
MENASPRHMTIVEELQYWARHDPTTPAFVFVDVTWRRRVLSRADVYRLASRYAAILHRQGIRKGDVVCNTLPNSPERLISDLGIVLAGAAAMNGQVFLSDGEDFIGSLKDAGCCAVILDPLQPKGAAAVLEARVHSQEGTHVHYPDLPNLHQLFLCQWDTDGEHQSFMDVLEVAEEMYVADVTPDDMAEERCTVAFMVPSQLLQLTDHCDQLQGQGSSQWRLRVIGSGGQPLRKKHMEAIGKATDKIHCGYGSTETGAISTKVVTDKDTYEDCNNGHTMPGVQLKVVSDDLKEVPKGTLGEIITRGPQLFGSYLNNDAATQKAFLPDGWYRTGDVGYINDMGEVFTVCRKAFSIMRGPYLLYPGWLEDRISRCPGVEDVMIVPVPDPVLYQELCACLIPQPGASLTSEGVRTFCNDLFLTSDKSEMTAVPKYYLFFQQFPTTNTGKTCRRSTTSLARQRLGLDSENCK